jgi:MFS family permease
MVTPASEALIEPVRPVSLGFQILLGLANAGATATLMPVLTVLIPAQVIRLDPVNSAGSLAFVLSLGAVGALIGNPLAGALSDRTTSPLGRRRPWLLIGMIGDFLGLILLAGSQSVVLMAAAWTMVQFFGNMLLSSYSAILPDRVPIRQRGTTQAIIGMSSPVAIVLSDLYFTQVPGLFLAYVPIIAVLILTTVLFLVLYHEAPLPKESCAPFRLREFLLSFWIQPRKYPTFSTVWLMWLLAWLGYTVGTGSFFFLYVQNITRYESLFPGHTVKEAIALVQMLQIIVGVPLMVVAGVLSDRVRKRKPFVFAGIALIGLGLVGLVSSPAWQVVLVSALAAGAGFWIFYSLGLAMITQLLPSASSRGKDLGVINIAATLPQIFMPPVGAAILNTFGPANAFSFQILFGIGAASIVLALLLMRAIHRL